MSINGLDRITELVEPSLRQCGVELLDAQWDSRGAHPVLRLVIDTPTGVTLDDCERVSNAVSAVLDAYDPIDSAYQLEVSSPGAERPLRDPDDWQRALGSRVNIHYRDRDATVVVEGRLVQVGGESLEIEARDGKTLRVTRIPVVDVVAGRRVVEV